MKKIYLSILFIFSFVFVSSSSFAFTLDTVLVVHPSCDMAPNGSVTVSQTGGIEPVMYSIDGSTWQSSPVFTGLGMGLYDVYAEDAMSDLATILVYMPQGASMLLDLIANPTFCYGGEDGSITINPVNETAPYSVKVWGGTILGTVFTSNSFSPIILNNLQADLYTFEVTDALGCIITVGNTNIIVPSGDSLIPATVITAPSCSGANNGYIQFHFDVGPGPWSIFNTGTFFPIGTDIINDEAIPLGPGTYSIGFQDDNAGCRGSMTVVIPDGLAAATITNADTLLCSGNSVELSGSGVASLHGTQYNWAPSTGLSNASIANPVSTPASTTTYTLTTTDGTGLCASSATVTIHVASVDVPAISLSNPILSVNNPQSGATYTWQQFNGTTWDDVGTGTSYTALSSSEYRVRASIATCDAYSSSQSAGRVASPNPFGIYTYPNPTTTTLRLDELKLADGWQTLEIINAQGRNSLPVTNISNQTKIAVNVASLHSGIYIIRLTAGDGKTTSTRFIKQ